jgi:putative DNA primase/helicase
MNFDDALPEIAKVLGGYAPSEIIADGKPHRFSTCHKRGDDAGYYIAHADEFPCIIFGDFRTNIKDVWSGRDMHALSPSERRKLDELKIERECKIKELQEAAADVARATWDKASEDTVETHPYLVEKGVGAYGVRTLHKALLVPVMDGSEIVALQMINPDGSKLFTKDGAIVGNYFQIGQIAETVVIGEGYATCASVHEETGLPIIVAFNCGNLEPVAQKIRKAYPTARIIVAADDDYKTEAERGFNPGIRDAKKAAAAINRVAALPPFDRGAGDDGTDFNDLAKL